MTVPHFGKPLVVIVTLQINKIKPHKKYHLKTAAMCLFMYVNVTSDVVSYANILEFVFGISPSSRLYTIQLSFHEISLRYLQSSSKIGLFDLNKDLNLVEVCSVAHARNHFTQALLTSGKRCHGGVTVTKINTKQIDIKSHEVANE